MAGAGAALPSGIGGSAFTVRDIEVDVTRKTAQLARIEAWREAARQAWPALWSRMTGNPAANAPELPGSAIEARVGAGPTSVVAGKSVAGRLHLGGGRIIQQKTTITNAK